MSVDDLIGTPAPTIHPLQRAFAADKLTPALCIETQPLSHSSADVISEVARLGLTDSTYFFYSSDHGFQLGQFNIPMDKRQVWIWSVMSYTATVPEQQRHLSHTSKGATAFP